MQDKVKQRRNTIFSSKNVSNTVRRNYLQTCNFELMWGSPYHCHKRKNIYQKPDKWHRKITFKYKVHLWHHYYNGSIFPTAEGDYAGKKFSEV